MKVTRDVVLDLLPLYLAGEASMDTRALIVEYLAQDPVLAERIRSEPAEWLKDVTAVPLPADLEVRALRRARFLISLQRWLFGPAIALTAVSLAIRVTFNAQVHQVHLLIQDYPVPLGATAVLAAVCWVGYLWARRRLR